MNNEFVNAMNTMATQLREKNTSTFARRVARGISGPTSDDLHIDACIIDTELQEVREVVALNSKGNFNQPDVIARGHALMEKLRT